MFRIRYDGNANSALGLLFYTDSNIGLLRGEFLMKTNISFSALPEIRRGEQINAAWLNRLVDAANYVLGMKTLSPQGRAVERKRTFRQMPPPFLVQVEDDTHIRVGSGTWFGSGINCFDYVYLPEGVYALQGIGNDRIVWLKIKLVAVGTLVAEDGTMSAESRFILRNGNTVYDKAPVEIVYSSAEKMTQWVNYQDSTAAEEQSADKNYRRAIARIANISCSKGEDGSLSFSVEQLLRDDFFYQSQIHSMFS